MPAERADTGGTGPRVAVIYELPPPKDYLHEALAEARIPVAVECRAGELDDAQLAGADVILVTLDEAMDAHIDTVADLVSRATVPVIFDECDVSRQLTGWDRNRWLRHLRAKLVGSSDTRPPLPAEAANSEDDDVAAETGTGGPDRPSVWLLGASVGGPESVRRFLESLPADVPAAFILVQHMGREFQDVLADRLARVTGLDVVNAETGQSLRAGRVIVAPVDHKLTFDDDECVVLATLDVNPPHSPSIDHTLFEVAERFGSRAGAIIFSGKALDGLEGCGELGRQGGQIWVQDAASATISATCDAVREAGLSTFEGTPEAMAERLVAAAERYASNPSRT